MRQVVLPIVILAVLFSALASAENETIKLGDYNVSFDLGLPGNTYNVDVKDPKQTETLSGDLQTTYNVWVTNDTSADLLIVGLIKSEKEPQPVLNTSELQTMLNSILTQSQGTKSNIITATRNVDDTEGAVMSYDLDLGNGIVKNIYLLAYAPKIYSPPFVLWAYSTFPWDNTLRFLKTIHIESLRSSSGLYGSFSPTYNSHKSVLKLGRS